MCTHVFIFISVPAVQFFTVTKLRQSCVHTSATKAGSGFCQAFVFVRALF